MAETQSTNLKLDLVDGDSNFDTNKVKSNFEKIDTAVGELTEKRKWSVLGTVLGATNIDISSIVDSAIDLQLFIWCNVEGSGERDYLLIIPTESLGNVETTRINVGGYYYNSTDYGNVQIVATRKILRIHSFIHGGKDVIRNCAMKVRYR